MLISGSSLKNLAALFRQIPSVVLAEEVGEFGRMPFEECRDRCPEGVGGWWTSGEVVVHLDDLVTWLHATQEERNLLVVRDPARVVVNRRTVQVGLTEALLERHEIPE